MTYINDRAMQEGPEKRVDLSHELTFDELRRAHGLDPLQSIIRDGPERSSSPSTHQVGSRHGFDETRGGDCFPESYFGKRVF